jgi:hypothetical protein
MNLTGLSLLCANSATGVAALTAAAMTPIRAKLLRRETMVSVVAFNKFMVISLVI